MTENQTDITPHAPRIAFLSNAIDDPNSGEIWRGIVDVARAHGAQVVNFAGGSMGNLSGLESIHAVVYDLVSAERVDGVILWGAMINTFVPESDILNMAQGFKPLPTVSIGLNLDGVPSVLLDNYGGMWGAISHLITAHNRRKIVFVGGPEAHAETRVRLRAYRDALAHHAIPRSPELVFFGNFLASEGETIVARLLDQRRVDFDAVAASDDRVAAAIVDALRRRKIHVPAQVAVIGFDDQEMARCQSIPLTTVRIPNYELGRRAAAMLFHQLEGEQGLPAETIPLQLAVRQSCGCPLGMVQRAMVRPENYPDLQKYMPVDRSRMIAEMKWAAGLDNVPDESIAALLDAFLDGVLSGTSPDNKPFLSLFNQLTEVQIQCEADLLPLEDLISTMRQLVLPILKDQPDQLTRAENSWQQARVLIAEAAQRSEVYRRIQTTEYWGMLNEIGQQLGAAYNRNQLADLIYQRLPEIGIQGCYLSVYEDPANPTGWSRLIAAYWRDWRYELSEEGMRFPSREWIPEGFSLREADTNWMFLPLNFNQEQIGFGLFEGGARYLPMYETLRSQIGSALKGASLINEVMALSLTDGLTGLANRRAFDLAVDKEIEHSHRFEQELALIMIDFDYFKEYNDSFGHPAGDEALILIARDLEKVARRGLDLVARLGGDEYAVLLVGTSLKDAAAIAEEIRRRALTLPGLLRPITLSLGVAALDGMEQPDSTQLIEAADRQLYQAKQNGRNRVGAGPSGKEA